ncbi:MAG: PASTA domain-containing protein [Lutibacter sp.]|nr:PASTA domain-containing protein [Lutibacter sp.]MBP9600396.1 PASTA domain-containing protein [Lutibacter sp.]
MSIFQFIKSKVFVKQLILALVAFLFFCFLVIQWLRITTNHSQKIEVPNLAKMSISDAENALETLDLEFVVIDSANYNPDYPPKSIIEQSPEAGQFVKENRKIYLTLNPTRYPNVQLPDILGKTKRQAVAQLLAVGFRVDTAVVYVDDLAEDVVRGVLMNNKELSKGDRVPQNSLIKLKVGDGLRGQLILDQEVEEVEEESIEF